MLKLFSFFLFFISVFVGYIFLKIPSEKEIKGCITTTMFEVDLCPKSKNYARLNQISPYVKKAVITTEDSLFYQHKGFDWESIEYSLRQNIEKGKYVRGGSTITQQLAKNMFLYRTKSLTRKFLEALITRKIEKTLKKNEILEKYLNVAQFGKNIFGVKAASQFYFKKHPSELTLTESAFFAFLLPSPEKYSRSFFRKELTSFARKRMRQILFMMYSSKKVSEAEYQTALVQLDYFPGQVPPEPEISEENTEPTLDDLENVEIE